MAKVKNIALLAVVVVLGYLGWRILFPNPERVIRSGLEDLARTVSFERGGGMLAQAYDISKVIEFFTVDVEGRVELRGLQPVSFSGRDEILNYAALARKKLDFVSVEFPDIKVKLGSDKQTAVANVTARVTVNDPADYWVQEVRFVLRLVDGRWMIHYVETVKVLAFLRPVQREGTLAGC
ncbi:MAG TPA: hypothetical protein PLH97_10395 [Verrucomicrobiota bacterium]|nr:hypothetical protein [Verrucomicrobiota bacterium]